MKYASFLKRLCALIIDHLLCYIPTIALLFLLSGGLQTKKYTFEQLSTLPFAIIFTTYNVFMLTKRNGQTIGKKLLSIKVITNDGVPLTWQRALLREFLGKGIISVIFFIGYLWALVDKRHQAFHDKIAGTFVINQ